MKFPYQPATVRGIGARHRELIWKPIVPIRVIGPNGAEEEFPGLLDTGAVDTILPTSLIVPLGVRLIPGEFGIIRGIGGRTSTAAFGVVDFRLSRASRSYRWSARVGFIEGDDVILGHSGFLRHFTASFDGLRRRVNLRPNGTFPEPIAGRAG